jgi:hypothetical protein
MDFLIWFLNSVIAAITFPIFDFIAIWDTVMTVMYYPVKILGEFNIGVFFTLWNLDWILTITLGLVKTVLRLIRGSK